LVLSGHDFGKGIDSQCKYFFTIKLEVKLSKDEILVHHIALVEIAMEKTNLFYAAFS